MTDLETVAVGETVELADRRLALEAPISRPEYGQIDPAVLGNALQQNLLLASHNAALVAAFDAQAALIDRLRRRLLTLEDRLDATDNGTS